MGGAKHNQIKLACTMQLVVVQQLQGVGKGRRSISECCQNGFAHALLLAINWWVWPRSAKKWGGHGRPSRPASYATVLAHKLMKCKTLGAFHSAIAGLYAKLATAVQCYAYAHMQSNHKNA